MQFSFTKETLPQAYAEAVVNNPLLARIEATGRELGWTDLEIRTAQLLVAVESNASLMKRLMVGPAEGQ
jgi:hypothetical protein